MQKEDLNSSSRYYEDEINFQEILHTLLRGKKIIFSSSLIFLISSLIYSISLPNIYESKALLSPIEEKDNISSSLESLGGLASIAGIGISPSNAESKSKKAKEKLTSFSFFEKKIMPNIFLPDLMAVDYWDYKSNTIIFDESLYDQSANLWVRSFSYPKKQIPSPQESFEVFINNHLEISEDDKTGFISLAIRHESPYIANNWVELMVREINNFYRDKDKNEAKKSISFLNEQLNRTSLSEIKLALVELLQAEIKKLTLVEARELYVFDYIDPSTIMEKRKSPNRAIIIFFGTMLGFFLGAIYVMVLSLWKKNTEVKSN